MDPQNFINLQHSARSLLRCWLMEFVSSEEQIRALIAKAIETSDPLELETVIKELRAALKEHIQKTKAMAVSSWTSRSFRDDH